MFLESPPPDEDQLKPDDTFHFSCHSELSCFNTCCRNKHLPLTPYDILRIKSSLGIHSDDFLARYVVYRPDLESGFPILSIKMIHEEAVCPFVTHEGCAVYHDHYYHYNHQFLHLYHIYDLYQFHHNHDDHNLDRAYNATRAARPARVTMAAQKGMMFMIGEYTFYFAVDNNADGRADGTWLDSIDVKVE